jgi:hypothetical protein
MPKLGYGYALYPGSPSSLPSNISGLSLWLKADAGVSTIQENFVSKIVLSGAGTASSNGTYVRNQSGLASFSSESGNSIQWSAGDNLWYLFDGYETYQCAYELAENSWEQSGGDEPAPSAKNTLTPEPLLRVNSWADQSGNNRNAIPIANKPVFSESVFNNKPAILFTPQVKRHLAFDHTGFYPKTIFVIGSITGDYQYLTMVGGNSNGILGNYYVQTRASISEPAFTLGNIDDTTYVAFANALTANTPYILGGYSDFLTSVNAFKNGVVGSGVAVSDVQRVLTTGYVGGGYYNGEPADNWDGYIAEVIIYNRVLTTQERQQVEGYLNAKYAIY